EQITGVDLLHAQIRLAAGATLSELGLSTPVATTGFAVQVRINAEVQLADGSTRPAAGTLSAYQPPSGPGLRVDGYGYAGYPLSPAYDSLLAKVIASAPDYPAALRRVYRALSEFAVDGVANNKALLQSLLCRDEVVANAVDTRFVERHLPALLDNTRHPSRVAESRAGSDERSIATPEGCEALQAHSAGVLVSLLVAAGDAVAAGQ